MKKQNPELPLSTNQEREVSLKVIEPTTPMQLMQIALEKGAVDQLEKLMQLQREWEDRIAKKSFFTAKSRFQYQRPQLKASSNAKITPKDSTKQGYSYKYAELDDISEEIKQALYDNGLTYDWKFENVENKKGEPEIKVICILTHVDGHSEETSLQGPDDSSGGKNAIQAKGASITYLQRYTLRGALGLSVSDKDTDGVKPKTKQSEGEQFFGQGKRLSSEQLKTVITEISSGKRNIERALELFSFSTSEMKAMKIAEENFKAKQKAV